MEVSQPAMWCKTTPTKYIEEVVTIEDSDEEMSYNNNNEEISPYKTRHNKKNETPAKKNEESDDEVIFVGEDTMELESLSKIDTKGKVFNISIFSCPATHTIRMFSVKLDPREKVSAKNFQILSLLGTGAYGRVYLVKKKDGVDEGKLYAMKVLEKVKVLQKKKTTEHTKTEREVKLKIFSKMLILNHNSFCRSSKR